MIKRGLNTSRIDDRYIRQNFDRLQETISNPFNSGDFKLLTPELTGNPTSFKVKHNLKFKPTDVLLTSAIWSGTVGNIVVNYSEFTDTEISVTITGQGTTDTAKLRLLVGRIDQ